MRSTVNSWRRASVLALVAASLIGLSACSGEGPQGAMNFASARGGQIDPKRQALAVAIAQKMRARGQRVWCVPFARNASGIEIRGDARTWWSKASGEYRRGHTPKVGAVMAFTATRKLPLGHVAVVSGIESSREIRVDHANWHRNRVSLDMAVVDVSKKNDWSRVRVMSNPGRLGRVYPVTGFIFDAN